MYCIQLLTRPREYAEICAPIQTNGQEVGSLMLMNAAEWREFRRMVKDIIPTVDAFRALESPTCGGVWVCARNRDEGDRTMRHQPVGEMAPDSSEERRVASLVKILMLCESPGIETSWEVRDPDHGRWGGGVSIAQMDDISISGFPEDFDTASVVYSLGCLNKISRNDAYRIVRKVTGALRCLDILETLHGQLSEAA